MSRIPIGRGQMTLTIIGMLMLAVLPASVRGDVGTRQQTIMPFNIPPGTPGIAPSNVCMAHTHQG